MKVQNVKEYIESQVPYKYVMNQFHEKTVANSCVVVLAPSGRSTRNTGTLLFQFLVRNTDPEVAEDIATQIYKHFNNKTDYEIGETSIIMSRGQQSIPLYTGTDGNNRHIYSVNIEVMVDSQ